MRAPILMIAALWLTACSAMDQLQQKRDDKLGEDDEETSEASGDKPVDDGKIEGAVFGLGDGCKFEGGCFVCEPRELPVEACVPKLPAGFDPAVACQREEKKLTCDVGGAEPFVFDFAEKNKEERLFDKLPGLLAGLQLFLGAEFKDKPEQLEVLTSAIEILSKHKKELFVADNADAAIDEAIALAKKKKPDLTDAQLADMKKKLQDALAMWKAKKKEKGSALGQSDLLSMASGMLGALPPSLAEKLPKLDVTSILAKLQGVDAGSIDLSAVSKLLPGGGGGLADILSSLLGGSKDDEDEEEAADDEEEADEEEEE